MHSLFNKTNRKIMSAFLIYAIVLTLVYIIYYSAMITKETYGAKGQTNDTTETFEFGDMSEQIESVDVNESEHGFYIGDEAPETEDNVCNEEIINVEDDHSIQPETETIQEGPSEAELHAQATEAKMEDIQPEYSDEFEPDEFDMILLNPLNTVPVIITTDTRDEL